MKLYYYKGFDAVRNFGDELNPWIWDRLLPEVFDEIEDVWFVGIGTLLNDKAPQHGKKIVMGSGVGYGALPTIDDDWNFYGVRGPLSAKALGLPESMVMGDPAMMVNQLFDASSLGKRFQFSYMPHWMSMHNGWLSVCEELDIHLINPNGAVEKIMAEIGQTQVLLSEAMHGAIVADALRVPWIAVHTPFGDYNPNKWLDWCQSIDLQYKSNPISALWGFDGAFRPNGVSAKYMLKKLLKSRQHRLIINQLKSIRDNAITTMSSDHALQKAMQQIQAGIDTFKADMAAGKIESGNSAWQTRKEWSGMLLPMR